MQSRRCKKEFPGRRLQEEGGPGELELSYAHCQEIHWQRRECDSLKHSQLKLEGCTKKEKKKRWMVLLCQELQKVASVREY